MTTSNVKVILPYSIDKVWEMVLDIENYCNWRSDLSRTERIDETRFIEYTKDGCPTTFTITKVELNKCWEFDMDNSNITILSRLPIYGH